MADYAKILSLTSTSAAATIASAKKTYFRSLRLIKDAGVVNPGRPSRYTNILLCGNCIDAENRNLYVFYVDTYFNSSWIIEMNIDSRVQAVVYYDKYNDIGFSPLHRIYNARVVHGRLVWTDGNKPIYQMDIARAKKSFSPGEGIAAGTGIGYGENAVISEWSAIVNYATNRIVTNSNYFYQALSYNTGVVPKTDTDEATWKRLCLIEDAYYSMNIKNFYFEPIPPKHPPVVTYESDSGRKINNLRQTLFQIAYRYVYMDWRKSTFSPASLVSVPQAEEETTTGLASEIVSLNNVLKINVETGGEEVRAIEIVGRSSDDPSKWFLIETVDKIITEERGEIALENSVAGYVALSISVLDPTVEIIAPWIVTNPTSFAWAYNQGGYAWAQHIIISCSVASWHVHEIVGNFGIKDADGVDITAENFDKIHLSGEECHVYALADNASQTGITGSIVVHDSNHLEATIELTQGGAPAPPPPSPTIYYSAAYGASFQKNNCDSGYIGSDVWFSVSYGAFTSIINQVTADAEAVAYVNANGQAYTNTNGTCTAIPPPPEFSVYNTGSTFLGGKTFTLIAEFSGYSSESDIGDVGFSYVRVGDPSNIYDEGGIVPPQSSGFSVTVTFPTAGTWYYTPYVYYQGVKVYGSSGGQDVT
jgi:hypothetical protein